MKSSSSGLTASHSNLGSVTKLLDFTVKWLKDHFALLIPKGRTLKMWLCSPLAGEQQRVGQ